MSRLTAVIVEDDIEARAMVEGFVNESQWLTLAGSAPDGVTAVTLINALKPDLIVLDVQLPGLTGLDVLRDIDVDAAIVFMTSHDKHLLAALHAGAVDYLVKPFGRDRFDAAVERAMKRRRVQPPAASRVLGGIGAHLETIFVEVRGKLLPICVSEITRIEACDDYARIIVNGNAYLTTLSLGTLEERLDARFVRVHRSHVVNLDHVREIAPCDADRRVQIRLTDGDTLMASRSGTVKLRAMRLRA